MVRKRGRRNYQLEDDADGEFDETFVVQGLETFYIDDEEVIVEDAVHAVKDGQEYVIIDNLLYPVDRSDEDIEPEEVYDTDTVEYEQPTESSNIGSYGTIIFGLIIGILAVVIAGPLVMGFVSGLSNSDNENIISPNGGQDLPTMEPTRVQSKQSETATKIKNAMDYTNPTTRDFAVSLIPNSHEGKYNIAQICDLWEAVNKKWTYVNDPQGSEYFSPASRTIQLGLKGDCDDFAITVGSVIMSIGGSSRIVTAYDADTGKGHAYPEVLVCSNKACMDKVASYIAKRYKTKGIAYHTRTKDGVTQYWMNLDWQSKYPGGKFFHDSGELTIYYPNGYWYKSG
jgi:predicted transglutaminase-like cysteine proteinase